MGRDVDAAVVEMVSVETCGGASSHCPNALIAVAEWKSVIDDWVREGGVGERLRMRLRDGRTLFHQRLRVSISGCPNGCSRPQIADIGLVGFVRPSVQADNCTACGGCAAACPDAAIVVDGSPPEFDRSRCQGCTRCRAACPLGCIRLSSGGVRILLGGKLGRHPHLAEIVGEETEPSLVTALLDRVIGRYLESAGSEERFSDFLLRCPDAWRP